MTFNFNDIAALLEVILIDIALSADNAIAVGLAASALAPALRNRAVAWGVGLALVLRVLFGLIAVQLMQIQGLMALGGLVLFWVAWRMWADLQNNSPHAAPEAAAHAGAPAAPSASFSRAMFSIAAANIALSLDNVLAVAGVARHAPVIMAFGLVLSVALMGVAAAFIAGVVERHRWIAYLGVAAIVLAGVTMCWEDGHRLAPDYVPSPPAWLGGERT